MELTINNLLTIFGEGLGFDIRLAGKYDKFVAHHVKMEIWYWGEGDPNCPSTWKWDKVYTAPTVLQCLRLFLSDMRGVELPGHIDLDVFRPRFMISKELSKACLDALRDDSGRIKPGCIIEVPAQHAQYIKPVTIKGLTKECRDFWDRIHSSEAPKGMFAGEEEDEPWFDEYYDTLPDAD